MELGLVYWLAQPQVQALIARGRETGSLTFDEVNAALANTQITPDQLAELVDFILDKHGIVLIDGADPEPLPEQPPPPEPPPVYHRDAAFDQRLRAFGVPFSDAMVSHEPNGAAFDAELIVPGEWALAAWLALRNAVPLTGLWPVIRREQNEAVYDENRPSSLDPGGRWYAWEQAWRRDRNVSMPEFTPEVIRADAAANIAEAEKVAPLTWRFGDRRGEPPVLEGADTPLEPSEPSFAALFANEGPFRCVRRAAGGNDWPFFPFVRIRLYPTANPWEVFAYSPYGGWNDAPRPNEQLAMLRYWHDLYGVEVVSVPGDWYELFVPRPPRTRHQALRLVSEMMWFGEETIFGYTRPPDDDAVERIRSTHYWYFWWD